jgi:hypothetical protein
VASGAGPDEDPATIETLSMPSPWALDVVLPDETE